MTLSNVEQLQLSSAPQLRLSQVDAEATAQITINWRGEDEPEAVMQPQTLQGMLATIEDALDRAYQAAVRGNERMCLSHLGSVAAYVLQFRALLEASVSSDNTDLEKFVGEHKLMLSTFLGKMGALQKAQTVTPKSS